MTAAHYPPYSTSLKQKVLQKVCIIELHQALSGPLSHYVSPCETD